MKRLEENLLFQALAPLTKEYTNVSLETTIMVLWRSPPLQVRRTLHRSINEDIIDNNDNNKNNNDDVDKSE